MPFGHSRLTRRNLFVAVVAAVAAAVAVYAVRILTSESMYTDRGTFAYWISIPAVIRGIPEINPTHPARFYSSAGDGAKPPENAVSYRSYDRPDAVEPEIDRYLTASGYIKRGDGIYQRAESLISLEIAADGSQSRVTVKENY